MADYNQVIKSFKAFMKFEKRSGKVRVDKVQIINALEKNGYEFIRIFECPICYQNTTVATCGDHYKGQKDCKRVNKIKNLVFEKLVVVQQ